MRIKHGLAVVLVAVMTLSFVPIADAFPVIRVRLPRIEVPSSAVRPIGEEQWVAGTQSYERRLADLGGDETALNVEETLLQLRYRRTLEELDQCLTAAGRGVVDGTLQSYAESGGPEDTTGVVAGVIGNCLDEYVPSYVPPAGREAVAAGLATQLVDGVAGVDESSSETVDVPIEWSQVSYETASETGSGTGVTSPGGGDERGGDDEAGGALVPALVAAGGLGLLLLLVKTLRRRV